MSKKRSGRCSRARLTGHWARLRSLVPSQSNLPDAREAVLRDLVDHIWEMNRRIQNLHEDIVDLSSFETALAISKSRRLTFSGGKQNSCTQGEDEYVAVLNGEAGLEVHIVCEKRSGLLSELMERFEDLGLAFGKIDVQCTSTSMRMDAFDGQNSEAAQLSAALVRIALLQIVMRGKTADLQQV